LLSIDLRII